MTNPASPKWPRRLRITLIVLVVILVALQTILAFVATPVARSAIASSLSPSSKLDRLYINLFGGTISIKGLRINQPDGFGSDSFISLNKAKINISLSSLLIGRVSVSSIRVMDLNVAIIKETNGVMNVSKLTAAPADGEPPPEATPEEASTKSGFAARIRKVHVERFSLTYLDKSKSETKPVEINLREAELNVEDLLFSPAEADRKELITRAVFTGRFEYADTPPSRIGLSARLGPVGGGAPGLVANLILSGFELGSAGSLVPPGVAATLAGDIVDINAKVRMAPDVLDLKAELETTGAKFPVSVGGTPEKPKVLTGELLLGAFGRVGNLVGNTATDVASAGMAVGHGAVNVASTVGKGAAGIVGGVGKGLLDVAKSAATLDVKGMGSNLTETVTSTGKSAINTVTDASSTAVSTIGDASKATAGTERTIAWRAGKQERYEKNWPVAQAWVNDAEYPRPSVSTNSTTASSNP